MESSYLFERKVISLCFNTNRDSVFILSSENDKMSLTEEDLIKNIVFRKFKLLKTSECQIKNTNYRKIPKDSYEGFSLYFWESTNKILVTFPFGYLLIYDYISGSLVNHFQCHGKKTYVIRNIIGSPIQDSIFISAQQMRNVYHINYASIKNGVTYNKLVLPPNEIVFDLVCHPNEKYIFVACSDSLIHIFDYSDLTKIKEIKSTLLDSYLSTGTKTAKGDVDVKKMKLGGVIAMDINNTGNFLISGNENGNIYLWDAFSAVKEKESLLTKLHISFSGVLGLKFLRTKQFQNLDRFICLTKDGKFSIFSVMNTDLLRHSVTNPNRTYVFNKLYENSTYNQIIYPLTKYNLITNTFINVSYFTNVISLTWPNLKIAKIKSGDKSENYLLFTSFSAKFFFFYDDVFLKINYPLSTQMSFLNYESYIPCQKKQLIFDNKIYMIDNFFIYVYEIANDSNKKLLNYTKEFNFKKVYPLKFEVRHANNMSPLTTFLILIENENNKKTVLIIHYDLESNTIKEKDQINDVIDLVLLGTPTQPSDYAFMINKDKNSGQLYSLSRGTLQPHSIEASVIKVYKTPFNEGCCVLYRNILNELKFSDNVNNSKNEVGEPAMIFKCTDMTNKVFKLDFSEREIDVVFTTYQDRIYCAISMIEKIVITDEKLRTQFVFKTPLTENPNLISSMFWIGKTLIFAKGSCLSYYYAQDNICQKIFTNNRPTTYIAGVLPDRFILISQSWKDIDNIVITTPSLNPMEPILIGYLDEINIDYNLVRECVVNMFTNQISQHLINKFISKDLKEVAWLFISDSKSSFQNVEIKNRILNDLLQFDKVIENLIVNKDLKNRLDLDEVIWRFNYDQSLDYIKTILTNEVKILIKYGQFDKAIKILELLGDYQRVLNLLLVASPKEEYEKIRVMFQAKNALSYSDNLLLNNVFCLESQKDESNINHMSHYNKIFDKYEGERFPFGANEEKISPGFIENIGDKINKKTAYITNIKKKKLMFGEIPYNIYVNNSSKSNPSQITDPIQICSLIIQKIENYYGTKNKYSNETIGTNAQRGTIQSHFQDFTIPLNQMSSLQGPQDNMKSPIQQQQNFDNNENNDQTPSTPYLNDVDDDGFDISPNTNPDGINETLYLTAYYHCDKGNGLLLEDITEFSNEATLSYIDITDMNSTPNLTMGEEKDKVLWTQVLDEFEPLEYEDKWGRKVPGPHSIKFSKQYQTKMIIPHSPSLSHLNKKFTIEMWLKLHNINVVLLTKDCMSIEIQNGEFKINYNNTLLQGEKIKDYRLHLGSFVHVTIQYHKKEGTIQIFLNCDKVIEFKIVLDKINIKVDLIFGNGHLDAEMTEIKIWNQQMPIAYLKETYKSPLPILFENKKKLKMKINKQDQQKKKMEFGGNAFTFGKPSITQNSINKMTPNNNIMPTPFEYMGNLGGDNIDMVENSIAYPSLNSVMEDSNRSIAGMHIGGSRANMGGQNEQNLQFGLNFDEINNQNFDFGANAQNAFDFQVNDFNFDK